MIDIAEMVHATVEHERHSTTLHPSAIDNCIRKEVLRIGKAKATHPSALGNKWFLKRYGTYEDYFEEAFDFHGIIVAKQPRYRLGDWSGRGDFLIEVEQEPSGVVVMIEVKSVAPGAINRGNIPYKHHKMQAWCYWVMMQEGEGPEFEGVWLAYIERWADDEVPRILQFDATPMDMEVKLAKNRMEDFELALNLAKDQKVVPEIPYEKPDKHPWDCTRWNNNIRQRVISCPYFGHCWSEHEAKYAVRDALPF